MDRIWYDASCNDNTGNCYWAKKGNSGLTTLVRQGIKCTINSRSIAICWLLETQYRDLRRGYSNWGLVVPPELKPSRLHASNRSGFCKSFWQGNPGSKNRCDSLVTWEKWSNNTMIAISFWPRHFHNSCYDVYFL